MFILPAAAYTEYTILFNLARYRDLLCLGPHYNLARVPYYYVIICVVRNNSSDNYVCF